MKVTHRAPTLATAAQPMVEPEVQSQTPAPPEQPAPQDPKDSLDSTREERIVHFLRDAKQSTLQHMRSMASAYAGELIGAAIGAVVFSPVAIRAGSMYVMTGGAALLGGAGALAGYYLQNAREKKFDASRPNQLGGLDVAIAAGSAVQSLPKFLYPTIGGATAAERAVIERALDSIPLSGVTSVSTIDVAKGLEAQGIAGVAHPIFSQSRIMLDRDQMALPGWNEEVVIHEVGHAFDFTRGFGPIGSISQRGGGFGSAPHVSDYAETNRMEDFAESYLEFHRRQDHLRSVAPEKLEALEAAQQQGVVDELMDRPAVREAGKNISATIGRVPYLRTGLELAGALLSPLQVNRGSRQLEEGLVAGDPVKNFEGKMNLASGVLLFFPGMAPLALATNVGHLALSHQVARGNVSIEQANSVADKVLAVATGPIGMIGAAAGTELEAAGISLSKASYAPGEAEKEGVKVGGNFLRGLLTTVGGMVAGAVAGSAIGHALGGTTGAVTGILWGRLAGGALGLGAYGLWQAAAARGKGTDPNPLDLTREDKIFLAKVGGGAIVGGLTGAFLGAYGGRAVGSAIGAALGGPAGAVTGQTIGSTLGMLVGSGGLGKAGAYLGRKLDG
ncbi:MAG: hypothetical protein HY319_28785 [Armatimonadetes bacterium]|nr:hypothetical protein [Armatimonadota bacterium]